MKARTSLAEQLVSYRHQQGLSQEELAQKANLSLRTVQRLENGQSLPRGYTRQILAKTLGIPIDRLADLNPTGEPTLQQATDPDHLSERTASYVALMYLAAFSYLLLPGVNILLPLLMRQRKRHNPIIYQAATELLNFELTWTLLTYGGYFLLLAAQIGLIFYVQIVIVLTPLLFLFGLNLLHVPILLIGAWKAKKGRYQHYAISLRLF